MNPFDNVVGLKPVDKTARLWVNDMPSVGNLVIDAIKEPEDYLPEGGTAPEEPSVLWNKIKTTAYDQLKLDLEAILSERGMFRSELATGQPMPLTATASDAGNIHALTLECPFIRYTELRLKGITVRPEAAGSVTVSLLDNMTGDELETTTANVSSGLQVLPLDWSVRNIRGLDISVKVVATTRLLGFAWGVPFNSDVSFGSLKVIPKINDVVSTETAHFEVDFSFGGSVNQLVESNIISLESAFLYICSVWVLKHLLSTYNFNVNTNTNRLVVEQNIECYTKDYQRYLKRASAILAKQLEGTHVFDVNPNEVGGIHYVSYV